MISLFIDTSLSFIRIAIIKNNFLVDSINEKCEKDLSRLFDVRVREILERNNLCFNDINTIYVVNGPGSFTGIRVGLTFAKVLAWSLNINIIPISELCVLASSCDDDFVIPLIDARRGFVYSGVYNSKLENIVSDKYVLLDSYLDSLSNKSRKFVSYDNFTDIECINPNIDFLKIIRLNKNLPINPHLLVPNYLKDTEAEERLRLKQENDQ